MNIELSYVILYAAIAIIAILGITRKMSMGIAIIGVALGMGVSFVLATYTNVVINPVGQAIFYGGNWSISAIIGLAHLLSMIGIVMVGAYNLLKSGGKITWA